MTIPEILYTLLTWTPYLAEGFLWNILISLVAMVTGTLLGAPLAFARATGQGKARRLSLGLTELARNVPTFVFLFYLAFIIPTEIELAGWTVTIPAWIKASLALSIAVVGFTSDTLAVAIRDWRAGNHAAAMLFVPSWTGYLLIIVMASSTASVIGVSELVSRCNTVIAAIGQDGLMLWVYLYGMVWFFVFCYPLNRVMALVRKRMEARIQSNTLFSRPPRQPDPASSVQADNEASQIKVKVTP